MNPLRRYETIMEILLAQKEVTVNELSERLDVTGKTIREDLAKLEEKGLLVRIHGGAVLAQSDQLGILSTKEPIIKHADQKSEIATIALRYIQPRDIIALDGGSTTLEIARRLDNQPLTVVTNDLFIISELLHKEEIRLVVPGGYRLRNTLAGPEAVDYVSKLNIQKSFISATGVHLQHGFTIYTSDHADYKRALIRSSATVYGVADHYKFGQCALRTFATLSEVAMILTDSSLPADIAKQYRDAGIQIVTQ
ncbi:DeoR/GlpR family DNA-binding transcription regulator [Paenibacillus sp. Soil787]|uniref:DeoR/GlpR family DNA-binding transcription regulator n=1 Tax=Paenibacillus sp. Soil787 TaxID=1736411 RepID=UPI0007033666|nr:DeoR/GlpR family DNA-binding transcription regulator [Paenibacillus sp. Soil787]KRF11172.1 DeoR family transcriptional regulator [Paenibacillus sp. Soil787]